MNKIHLSTNLHCNNCVAKLGKVLDAEPKIKHWSADVQHSKKPVIIHGDIDEREAKTLIQKAGFSVSIDEVSAEDVHLHVTRKPGKTFWKDKLTWRKASFNTLNCLIGCSIGDFGMIIFLQVYYPQTPMWLQMLLAIIAGLLTSIALESSLLRWKEKMAWNAAVKMALSMSFISMVAMEVMMNLTDFMITGGKAQLGNPVYWLAFVPAALAGFLTPLPYNYYQLKKHKRSCH